MSHIVLLILSGTVPVIRDILKWEVTQCSLSLLGTVCLGLCSNARRGHCYPVDVLHVVSEACKLVVPSLPYWLLCACTPFSGLLIGLMMVMCRRLERIRGVFSRWTLPET